MTFCDMTLAYTKTSGGIRTYIDQKREFIAENTEDSHALIVPSDEDCVTKDGRLTLIEVKSPLVPGCAPYRFFWRPSKLREALEQVTPDVIELGSFFVCPWVAFDYRDARIERGEQVLVSGYFHTDIASAYFASPIDAVLQGQLEEHSETLHNWRQRIVENVEDTATSYFGKIFNTCDIALAASKEQADRLKDYDVENTHIIPLGVDPKLFHPEKRQEEIRRSKFRVKGPEDVVFLYAGRLDVEKSVKDLVDAFEVLGMEGARLVLVGEGPMRESLEALQDTTPGLIVLPYETDREAYAALLASADVYVTAGEHETFGLSVVEAQASGLPVVGVAAGALTERVHDEIGRLGAPKDAELMAQNMKTVADDRRAMGRRAREHVREQGLDWDGSIHKLLDLYRGRLDEGRD